MINRTSLRIKVLQALYAYMESGEDTPEKGVNHLMESIDKMRDLFVWQLSFLIETKRFAENRIEENKRKNFPTQEDLNPNMRYVNNRIIQRLEDNKDLAKEEQRLKINWADHQDIIRGYHNMMRNTEEYAQYMNDKNDDFRHDKKFITTMISKYFADLEVLQDYYEEKSIFFVDDYHLVSAMLLKFINDMKENFDEYSLLPKMYRIEKDDVNNKDFAVTLFRETLSHYDEYGKLIGDNVNEKKWEKERICVMDMIILRMAITEFLRLPYVPVKVSMNEYIEISKYFSTPKSKIFVNGILDKVLKKLKEDNAINKKGAGLIE